MHVFRKQQYEKRHDCRGEGDKQINVDPSLRFAGNERPSVQDVDNDSADDRRDRYGCPENVHTFLSPAPGRSLPYSDSATSSEISLTSIALALSIVTTLSSKLAMQ